MKKNKSQTPNISILASWKKKMLNELSKREKQLHDGVANDFYFEM